MDLDPVFLAAGAVSFVLAYLALQASGAVIAMTVFLLSMTVVFFARATGISGSLSVILNPFVSFFPVFCIAFIYFSTQGGTFLAVLGKSLGAGFIWGAVSMTLNNIWGL